MGPSGRIGHILYILDCLGQVYAGLYLGRAPRTKETLPDFLKWRRVTRPPLVFRGLTGSQRTPGFWGVTTSIFFGSTWIPSFDTMCPRKDTSFNQNSHLLNFAYNCYFLKVPNTTLRCVS